MGSVYEDLAAVIIEQDAELAVDLIAVLYKVSQLPTSVDAEHPMAARLRDFRAALRQSLASQGHDMSVADRGGESRLS
jgi:hypothetical protein